MKRRTFISVLGVAMAALLPSAAAAGQPPQVRITNIRRVFHNGEHNAFTDLVRFRDRFYLTFRSCPDGHMVHPSASIIILASTDAKQWEQVHRFSVDKRDTRDPHFLIVKDTLFVYTGTWYCGQTSPKPQDYDLNQHLGYAAWSKDGAEWHSPILLEGTFGHYIWRANAFDGKAYLCGRRKQAFAVGPRGEGPIVESAMLASDDGLIWRTRALFPAIEVHNTAFQFAPHGKQLGRSGFGIVWHAPQLHALRSFGGAQRCACVHRQVRGVLAQQVQAGLQRAGVHQAHLGVGRIVGQKGAGGTRGERWQLFF